MQRLNPVTGSDKPGHIRELLENLIFRRQFLLGPSPFSPTPQWKAVALSQGLILSSHPDLDVVSHSSPASSVTLLGFIIDPFNPARTSAEIVRILAEQASSLADLLLHCEPLSGRFALIYQSPNGSYILTDPCGFRQVYYYTNDHAQWCGSQPEIIRAAVGLEREDNEDLLAFMLDPGFANNESSWVGDRTPYKHCRLLLPNHYLKLGAREPERFFPASSPEKKAPEAIIETAATILKGSFAAIAKRTALTMPVTSGYDSRVLLAASRSVSDRIEYYIDRKSALSEGHPDVWLPSRMTRKLGIDFVIKNSQANLPGWFVGMLANNVTGARVLLKTRMIYGKFMARETRMNINGNGSEICRNHYETLYRIEPDKKTVTVQDLARCLCYPGLPFVNTELERWQADILTGEAPRYNILDMLMWEQDLGIWGAQYPAEQDIAVEEFSPFNCRLLITTLLAAPRELRVAPHFPLYRQLIEAMWPELLAFPFNPPPKLNITFHDAWAFLKSQMKPYTPRSMVYWLKSKGIL